MRTTLKTLGSRNALSLVLIVALALVATGLVTGTDAYALAGYFLPLTYAWGLLGLHAVITHVEMRPERRIDRILDVRTSRRRITG